MKIVLSYVTLSYNNTLINNKDLILSWFCFLFSPVTFIASSTQSVCISWLKMQDEGMLPLFSKGWMEKYFCMPQFVMCTLSYVCFLSLRLPLEGSVTLKYLVPQKGSVTIKIHGFLKAFKTKVFFCSFCCALSGVSISTLANLIGDVTW